MSEAQRWKPTKCEINKIKMEFSPNGKYVRREDYLELRGKFDELNFKYEQLLIDIEERGGL